MKRKVLRTTPGWPLDVNGVWIRKGQVGEFSEAVATGSRSCWLEVVATPPSVPAAPAPAPPKVKRATTKATKATKATKRKRATTKTTTGDRD